MIAAVADKTMRLEIVDVPESGAYAWKLWDGPDGIDFHESTAPDLDQCLEQIMVYREIIRVNYLTR